MRAVILTGGVKWVGHEPWDGLKKIVERIGS